MHSCIRLQTKSSEATLGHGRSRGKTGHGGELSYECDLVTYLSLETQFETLCPMCP